MGISYSNVLILWDAWTLHDLDRCSMCPDAIAEGQPSISIIINDEIVYSVGSDCTNLSTQESMPDYSFIQSEADTILFCAYAVLRDTGYSGPVVADTDS